jgi:signal transduction histidine kinase
MSTQIPASPAREAQIAITRAELYEHAETRELVALVEEAAELVRTRGEAAFAEFRTPGSRWLQGETYIFVLDPEGFMLVHPDPALEGRNDLALEDVSGKPIVRGLIAAAGLPDKPHGWYHYQWPVPDGILPRWKSSYVWLVQAPSGKPYIVGSGMYNDRMERAFVADMVTSAIAEIEQRGEEAYPLLRDPKGRFLAKDAYIFVFDMNGVELFNPAFPSLEGRDILGMTDTRGKQVVREMLDLVRTRGASWIDYMWPEPGEGVSTQKSAYVSKTKLDGRAVVVGCGVYLADAPREAPAGEKLTAPELMTLVCEAAAVLEERGEQAYPELRMQGSKWFRDDTYLFVSTMEGIRAFHAAEPECEGLDLSQQKDVLGRPIVKMILEAGASPTGEGWIHYMYPEPGSIFPAWKSSFVKRVTFPSGEQRIVGCGIYNLQMDQALIEDVVDRAAALIAERGEEAFGRLRDKTGPFVFMHTYVFVVRPDGTELVNPAFPSLEGRNNLELKDLQGEAVVQKEIAAAMQHGSAWVEGYWYKPGTNTPARKLTYVCRVQAGAETFIVGSGIYVE